MVVQAGPGLGDEPPAHTKRGYFVVLAEEPLEEPFVYNGYLHTRRLGNAGQPEDWTFNPFGSGTYVLHCVNTSPLGVPEYSLAGPYYVEIGTIGEGVCAGPATAVAPSYLELQQIAMLHPAVDGVAIAGDGEASNLTVSTSHASDPGYCNAQFSFFIDDEDDAYCDRDYSVFGDYPPGPDGDIDAHKAWPISKGQHEVVVAVADLEGVAWYHPDLADQFGLPIPETLGDYFDLAESAAAPRVWRNPVEERGDANGDGASGTWGINEDNDRWTDEDPTGLVWGNTTEQDVFRSEIAGVEGDRVIFVEVANWQTDELAGRYLTLDVPSTSVDTGTSDYKRHELKILGNDASSVVVDHAETDAISRAAMEVGGWECFDFDKDAETLWSDAVGYQGQPVWGMVSDLRDTDGDGVVDDWWSYNPGDDDENGVLDDVRGFRSWSTDRVYPLGYSSTSALSMRLLEDRFLEDGITPFHDRDHGTANAGVVLAREDDAALIGVAPRVRLVPVYIGRGGNATAMAIRRLTGLRAADGSRLVDVIVFAQDLDGDRPVAHRVSSTFSIRTSTGELVNPEAAALEAAIEAGIVIVNGSGNSHEYHEQPYYMAQIPGVIAAGGLLLSGRPWVDLNGGGMNAGPWLEILAPAQQVAALRADETVPNSTSSNLYVRTPGGIGTSRSSPHVGGVAALLKSAYPHMDGSAIRDKIVQSTTPVDYSGTQFEGLVTAGRLDAYRALTWYGDLSREGVDQGTSWEDEVWISGDIYVPTGHRLTIAEGTAVHVAQDDIENRGDHPTKIEWFIEGEVIWEGTPSDPIVFSSFSDSEDSLWVPPAFAASVQGSPGTVVYEDALRDSLFSDFSGSVSYVGQQITIEWTTDHIAPSASTGYDHLAMESGVNLDVSVDHGQTYFSIATGVSVAAGSYQWTPGEDHAAADVLIRATFTNSAGHVVGTDTIEGPRVLLEATTLSFAPVPPATTGLDLSGTEPYAVMNVDYDGDGDEDVVVADGHEDLGQGSPTRVFANTSPGSGGVGFDARHGVVFNGSPIGARGLAHGIVRAGEPLALLICQPAGDTRLHLWDGAGFDSDNLDYDLPDSSNIWAGAFADYDLDGDLDLYLARALPVSGSGSEAKPQTIGGQGRPDVLLRWDQNLPEIRGYTDVAGAALPYDGKSESIAATWGDVNGDRFPDLFVSYLGTGQTGTDAYTWSPLYINQRDGTFLDKATNILGTVTDPDDPPDYTAPTQDGVGSEIIDKVSRVSGARFVELDGDGDLDIVITRESASGKRSLIALLNNPTGTTPGDFQQLVPSGEAYAALREGVLQDVDANGVVDIVSTSSDESGEVSVLLGRKKGNGELHFDNATGLVGVTPGQSGGVKLADYDGDGDLDLLLGRAQDSSGQDNYYYSNSGAGVGNQLSVVLDASGSGNPESGIGAKVTVTPSGGTPVVQYVDGGSGRGSQDAGRLRFGIGSAQAADVEVVWPDGTVSVVGSAAAGTTVSIVDDHSPGLVAGSLGVVVSQNGSDAMWKFTWETTSAISDCEIQVESNSHRNPDCEYGGSDSFVLDPDESSVGHQVVYNFDTQRYEHRLALSRDCVAACAYDYRLRVWSGTTLQASGWQSFALQICGEIQQ